MSKQAEIDKFGLESYDDFLCLRPPRLLIGCLVFLCRGLVIFVLAAASRGSLPGLNDLGDTETVNFASTLATLPAALVLYAVGARVPSAPAFVRWIWRQGRTLVLLSAAAYVALAVTRLAAQPRAWAGTGSLTAKAMVAVELGIIGYVLLSDRVRHAFQDFPTE